jgi:hypothetical protein
MMGRSAEREGGGCDNMVGTMRHNTSNSILSLSNRNCPTDETFSEATDFDRENNNFDKPRYNEDIKY